MSLYSIATKYNGQLAAAQSHIDDGRDDMVEFCAAGQLKLDLTDQLRRRSITSTCAIRLSSANELV